jgi:GT2 family glycosyltransferase
MLTPLDMKLSPWGKWEQEMLMKQYAAMQKGEWQPTGRQFYTGNSSLARRYLLESGGFDTTLRRAEDIELAYRLEANGLRFHFHPDAIGYHYVKRSYQSWVQIAYDYGVNDVTFHKVKKHEWLLPNLFKEFQTRNYGIKGLTWLCLDHPSLSNLITRILRTMIIGKQHLSFEQLYMALCSVIFNLRYYQGVADALGGREIFFEVLSSSKTK